MKSIEEIIRTVWGDTPVRYEPLNGGFVNFTYKVQVNGGIYALRINGGQNDYLGLSRQDEMNVVRLAGDAGIAPKVLPQSTVDYLITEYIDAPVLNRDDIMKPSTVQKAMDTLKKIHGLTYSGRSFSAFDLIGKHLEGMKTLGVSFPKELDELLPEVWAIQERFVKDASYRKAYCHNDYYTFNILNADSGLRVIDWELSGEGDIFFDIATLSFHDAFTAEQDEQLLGCYFGEVLPEHIAALRDMKYMNMLREATWGLLHSGMKEETVNHSLDYLEHGMSTLKKMKKGMLHL